MLYYHTLVINKCRYAAWYFLGRDYFLLPHDIRMWEKLRRCNGWSDFMWRYRCLSVVM